MRVIPNVRFGTEHFPNRVARRLRALTFASWSAAAIHALYAIVLLHDLEHFRWLIVLNAVWTLIDASVPLLYRFGRLAGPVATMSGATL